MLITYVSVAVCLASFVALLISRSSPRSKIRLRNRAIVAPALALPEPKPEPEPDR